MISNQGALDVYAAVSVALVVAFGVLVLISLLNITGKIRVPRRVMDVLLLAASLSIVAAIVAALLAVLL